MKLGDIIDENKLKSPDEFLNDPIVKEIIHQSYVGEEGGWDMDEWQAFSNSDLLNKIVPSLYNLVEEKWSDFDYVAALGGSGSPIGCNLATQKEKKFIFINDLWGATRMFQPIKPQNIDLQNKNVLLVDSVLKTGLTVYNALNRVKEKGGVPSLLIMTLLNGWIDKGLLEDTKLDIKSVDFYYLYHWDGKIMELAKSKQII